MKYGSDPSPGLFPRALVDRVKAEWANIAREGRSQSFFIECRSDQGVPHVARVRSPRHEGSAGGVFEISLETT